MVTPPVVFASDLVPWWFAVAFWVAFAALMIVVVRDVRRLGGPRAVARALREGIDRFGDGDPPGRPPTDDEASPQRDAGPGREV